MTLSWTKASDASITGYQFKQGTNAWAKITDSGPATVEHTVTGLSNGTAYTFQIRAMQGAVEGAESDPVTATPVAAAAQPTGLAATANHLGATLTWTDPSDSTITAYQFRQSADGGTTWNPDWAEITGSTGTTVEHTVTGLTNGTEYTFQIRAMRGNVASVATGSVTATPGPAAPAAPADFSATSGDGSAILSWTAAADNGSPITKYQYQQDSGAWTDIDASATSFTVTGLTNDVEYTFKLRAVNNIGEGAESDAVSATPIALPVAPINLMITKITVFSSTVTLGWSNPGNSSITGYQVRQSHSVDSAGDRVWGIWESFLSSVHTESTNVRVSYGIEYAFQIRAVNAAGAGAASDTVTAALPSAKPANFAATEGDGQVKLSWTNPNDGTITGYEVQQSTDGGTTWDPAWAEIVGSSRTTVEHTVTGLTNGTTYTFQIRAMQGTLTGAESDTVTATPSGKGSPLAPTGFSAASGDESANLSWTAADDNGSPITRYQYQQDGGDWTDITASAPGGANAVSFTVTGLANGIVYVFKLRAVNSGGAGAATGEASATPVAAQTTEINLWSATLTVGKNSDYPWYGFGGNSDNTKYGAITPNSFTYNGETYDIDVLNQSQGGMYI